MTQEDRNLLLRDLCARLPYRVIAHASEINKNGTITDVNISYNMVNLTIDNDSGKYELVPLFDIKPYLRPMSSMTEDEREEIEVFIFNKWYEEDSCKIDKEGWIEILANYDVSGIDPCFCSDYIDWLLAHHFDYRGLIKKGLALEAPKGMYKME